MLAAMLLTFVLNSARQAFELMMSVGAGTGLIYLLRWYWWRINAWSEISAMTSSFLIAVAFAYANRRGTVVPTHIALISTVAVTTVVWVMTTLVTKPTERATLVSFYERVRPAGPGWRPVREEARGPGSPDSLGVAALASVLGCAFIYSALFGTGSLLYGHTPQALVWGAVFAMSGAGLWRIAPRALARSDA
jgi:hypothetical protein